MSRTPRVQFAAGWLALVLLCMTVSPLHAVVVLIKGQDEPKVGYLIERTDALLVMQVQQPDGTFQRETFPADQVDAVVQSVSTERLEALSPDQPSAYREYAEELADKRRDPEAADAALRLYAIAAHLDPQGQGRGSLLGMTRLVDDPEKIRRLRAMAYLADPRHDPALLQKTATSAAAPEEDPEQDTLRDDLLLTLRNLRRGNKKEAKQTLDRPEIRAAWPARVPQISLADSLDLAEGTCPGCQTGPAPPYLKPKLIAAELSLLPPVNRPKPKAAASPQSRPWSELADSQHHKPLATLSLKHLTGHDPAKSIYRNGKWQAPGE